MIKIIKKVTPKAYEWTCKRCGSIFQFQDVDCTKSYDRTSCILCINCPVCGRPTDSTEQWRWVSNTDGSTPPHDYEPPRHSNGMPIL